MCLNSQNSSGGHTRTNSSKAQSLRDSVLLSKPLVSHFSSIASAQGAQGPLQFRTLEKIDKKMINKFLRETFNGVLPEETGVQHLQRRENQTKNRNNELNDEVQKYM